jgi:DNA modification methylase
LAQVGDPRLAHPARIIGRVLFHCMTDTRNPQPQPPTAERTRHSDGTAALRGLHDWGGHTREGLAWEIHKGDALTVLKRFASSSFNCVVTSPPYYWQRDYQVQGQIGQEKTIDGFVKDIADTMDEVRRVLAADGLLFLNLGDTYYSAKGQPKGVDKKSSARRFGLRAVDASGLGVPRKTVIGIPWRVALEMIERGWVLRSPIVWTRTGAIPEPTAKDRPWRTYEMIFMFSKSPRYYFSRSALNKEEDIWTISARRRSNGGLHAAAYPEELVERCIQIGCPEGGRVLDPFAGTGTTLRVALRSGRSAVGIDLSEPFCDYMVNELRGL